MHELVIAQQVVRAVLSEMERRGAASVRSVDLELGVLEGLRPADLARAFQSEAAGTPLDGTELRVTPQPVRAFCPKCGTPKPFDPPAAHGAAAISAACPDCGAALDLEGGRGFRVVRATMVLEDP